MHDQVAWAGEPNWTELTRLVYGQPSNVFGHGSKDRAAERRQWVREVRLDCDGDALLVRVDQEGPACHTGDRSCFDADVLLDARSPHQA